MARLRRRPKSRTGWNDDHRFALLHHDWFGVFVDSEHERAAWNDLKGELLPQWIKEEPGSRPRPWWLYDMPAGTRRERIDGGVHPHDDPENDVQRNWFFGKPGQLRPCDMDAEYESQQAYLWRNGLLSAAEIEAIERIERANGMDQKQNKRDRGTR